MTTNFGINRDIRATNFLATQNSILPGNNLSGANNRLVPFAPLGSIAYNSSNKNPIFSDGLEWHQLSFNTEIATVSITWAPDYTGAPFSNIYTEWEDAVNALSLIGGKKFLFIDPNYTTFPITIPQGIYDMTDVTLAINPVYAFNTSPNATIPIIVPEGVTFINLLSLRGLMGIEYQGTTSPAVIIDISQRMRSMFMDYGVTIECTGTQPFWQYTDTTDVGGQFLVSLFLGSSIAGSNPVIDIQSGATGVTMILSLGILTNLTNNTLSSNATSTILISIGDPSIVDIPWNPSVNQPNILGISFLADNSIRSKRITQSGPPTILNNDTQGFRDGDIWIDSVAETAYICVNASAGTWNGPI